MNINLHIESLVLDGVSMEPHQQARLKTAVASELGRLLASNGIAPNNLSENELRTVDGGSFTIGANRSPRELGKKIARAVYGGVGK